MEYVPFVVLLVTLALGLPIAFSLLLSGLIGIAILKSWAVSLSFVAVHSYEMLASFSLIVIPLFIVTGYLAFAAGISTDFFEMAYRWLGRLRGGVAVATIAACAGFAATSGSSTATAATVGKIAIPEMKRFRYSDQLATGVVSAGGTLGGLIPPSILLVIYGIAAEESIGALLIAGIIPGILTAFIYMVGTILLATFKPNWAPRGPSFPWRVRLASSYKGWGVIVLFLVIMGGIYTGIFTPSEAAAWGALSAIVIALIRRVKPRMFREQLWEGTRASVMIMLIVMAAATFSQYVALSGMAVAASEWLIGLPVNRYFIILFIILMWIPLGMFLEPACSVLIVVPVVFSAIVGLGFDPIWFGIIVVKMALIGCVTPPVGLNVFIIKGVAPEVPLESIFKGAAFFVALEVVALSLLVAFPQLCTWLPNTMLAR